MKKIQVEIADSPIKRDAGLMHRKHLANNQGMLFKFPSKHYLSFWMKNTYIPLDIAFINDQGKILQIEAMSPLNTKAIYSQNPCRYALEVNRGWFKENNIDVGSNIFGEGFTHRNGKIVEAQGFVDKLKGYWDKLRPKDTKDKVVSKEPEKVEEKESDQDDKNFDPPESAPEGDFPTTVQTEPVRQMEPMEEGNNPNIQYFRDMRGKIRYAEDHGLQMEILYWTMNGHMLPPRRVQVIEGEGFPIKNGPKGEYLVAFDISPTIQGGDGWSIKGMQPKSFLIDNIVNLSILDRMGNEIDPNVINQLKEQEKQEMYPQQEQAVTDQSTQPEFFPQL